MNPREWLNRLTGTTADSNHDDTHTEPGDTMDDPTANEAPTEIIPTSPTAGPDLDRPFVRRVNPDDTASHIAEPDPRTVTVACIACNGTGRTDRTVSELLRGSIAMIPPGDGQHVIRSFYRRLLDTAPGLAPLFPADLLDSAVYDDASPGKLHRDKLLQALTDLADLYGTTTAARARLDTTLRAYGRHHAAFARPDGSVRGATIAEYVAVKNALIDTLHATLGDTWQDAYEQAWGEAFDYAAAVMLHEQLSSGMTAPRYPRAPQA